MVVATTAWTAEARADGVAGTIRVGRTTRSYRVHTPPELPAHPALVVVLHGAGATAEEIESRYHWDPLADREGFVVAYPQGVNRRWNDAADPGGPDDVGFLRALLDALTRRYAVDTHRIYIAGISNGGLMTYRAGCALSGRLAAIGAVAAWFPPCRPKHPVSVVHVHGLDDGVLLFAGGSGYPSVERGLARWRADDGCPPTAAVVRAGEVTHTAWEPCRQGTAVELYTIDTGRHEWPGADPKPGNDPVSNALDATGALWSFFQAHAR